MKKRKYRRSRHRARRSYRTRRNWGRQMGQARGVATSIIHDGGMIMVAYHGTPVVKFDDKKIILNTGGYKSATTKTRMNQASNQFGLGYRVEQKNGRWFAIHHGVNFPFGNSNVLTLKR